MERADVILYYKSSEYERPKKVAKVTIKQPHYIGNYSGGVTTVYEDHTLEIFERKGDGRKHCISKLSGMDFSIDKPENRSILLDLCDKKGWISITMEEFDFLQL